LDSPTSTVEHCLKAIEDHFLTLKPLFTRRLELFKMTKGARPFKIFVADLRRHATEAELADITTDQLLVYLALASTRSDTTLFIKLRKLKDPSLDDLQSKADAHEAASHDATTNAIPISAISTNIQEETIEEVIAALAAACHGCGGRHERERCPFRHF
jgi:hypothetical protein